MHYKSPGRCIYCGDAKAPLTKEHIVPRALGGIHVLRAASCLSCAKITSAFERAVSRRMLGNFRVRLNFPTGHKNERPKTLPVINLNHPDVAAAAHAALSAGKTEFSVKVEPLEIEPGDYPPSIELPQFPQPKVLRGLPKSPDVYPMKQSVWGYEDVDALNRLRIKHGSVARYPHKIPVLSFVRMLAKIAHCGAVSGYGLDAFRPLLLDLILGRTNDFTNFVGGELSQQPKEVGQYRMTFSFQQRRWRWFLCAHFRLFPELCSPLYHIVVGEIDGPLE